MRDVSRVRTGASSSLDAKQRPPSARENSNASSLVSCDSRRVGRSTHPVHTHHYLEESLVSVVLSQLAFRCPPSFSQFRIILESALCRAATHLDSDRSSIFVTICLHFLAPEAFNLHIMSCCACLTCHGLFVFPLFSPGFGFWRNQSSSMQSQWREPPRCDSQSVQHTKPYSPKI
jgi:hypothetical protein